MSLFAVGTQWDTILVLLGSTTSSYGCWAVLLVFMTSSNGGVRRLNYLLLY